MERAEVVWVIVPSYHSAVRPSLSFMHNWRKTTMNL
jgi:hypothetical protein